MGNRNPLLEAALTYAARGWPVFPCREKDGEPYLSRDGKLLTPREKQPYTTHSDRPTCPTYIRNTPPPTIGQRGRGAYIWQRLAGWTRMGRLTDVNQDSRHGPEAPR